MKEKQWYEYEEDERVKNVYSKTTLQEFWDWWSDKENKVMEIRIKDFILIKEIANKLSIPYSISGVYVNNVEQLKYVLKLAREKATMWFGINPKKKNTNRWGKKSYGGRDVNINEIGFIFVDIDRQKKSDKPATKDDLKDADILANKILDRLETYEWNKGYIKICSGHGVQLVIKLDFPLKMPEVNFKKHNIKNPKTKKMEIIYGEIIDEEFQKYKEIIRLGIGAQILKFSRKFKDELRVEVDKSGFNIGRVAALHCSKNWKYNTFRWRGIVELKNKINAGLSDYVMSKEEDIKQFKEQNVFSKSRALNNEDRIKKGKLMEHKLIKFILQPNLPVGGGNNKLWFQLKCLLRDSKTNLGSTEFREFHSQLEKSWMATLSTNPPTKNFDFDKNIINSYCLDHHIPLLYDFWSHKKILVDMYDKEILKWEHRKGVRFTNLDKGSTIQEDLKYCLEHLREGDKSNYDVIGIFINGLIKKYGEEKARFYFDNLFDRAFNYR